MSGEKEESISAGQTFAQLAYIKSRLETYPISNHEAICMRDCMLLLIRTFAGEEIPEAQLISIGGGVMEGDSGQGHTDISIGGAIRKGGVEIAPGVVQYPAAQGSATMDVEASEKLLRDSNAPARAPTPSDMPKPVAGSLMARALESEGKKVETVPIEVTSKINSNVPVGIPDPSETRVEITS